MPGLLVRGTVLPPHQCAALIKKMSCRSWCFTLNYNADTYDGHLSTLQALAATLAVDYLLYGRESAPTTGQRHLQGYIVFSSRRGLNAVRALLPGAHFERAKGSHKQNYDYCTKDGDFEESGELPADKGGKRPCLWESYREWCKSLDHIPSDLEIVESFPALYGRYRSACRSIADLYCPRPTIRVGELRDWQSELEQRLEDEPDDRTVEFFVDVAGGVGKSWFCGYLFSKLKDVQVLGPGKRDDLAHVIDVGSRIFLFNVPRKSMEFLNYGFLESLKDRMVFSPKYESQMKILKHKCHVIVMCNEMPDMEKMSADRYVIHEL
ncbi:replication-associated protein [Giant panda circovirus 2]|uniref:Replication-associated protein n=1 Tax=Giant panda circovirus 2 TaxID=2016457 RepID=A0A220IGT9_9CIRC|nr:replication-associated protein [Giant panda circovirus 2]ASH99186.1 replication-associated protein [Giant panda circovirus 2]